MPPPPTPTSTRDVSLSALLALASFAPTAYSSHPSPGGAAGARRPAQHRRQHRARVQCPLPWTLTFTVKQFPHMPIVEAREVLVDGLAPYGHLAAITPVRPPPASSAAAATDTFEIEVRLHDSRTIPPSRLRVWLPVVRRPWTDDDRDETSHQQQLRCPYFVKVGPPRKGAVTSYCVYCHATDHLRADCVKAGACAGCGKMGHFVGTCPDALKLRTPPRRTKRFYDTAVVPRVDGDGT
ncbi:hypothetical protein V1506DRAFT_503016 [Lipomyces tetrasporus]